MEGAATDSEAIQVAIGSEKAFSALGMRIPNFNAAECEAFLFALGVVEHYVDRGNDLHAIARELTPSAAAAVVVYLIFALLDPVAGAVGALTSLSAGGPQAVAEARKRKRELVRRLRTLRSLAESHFTEQRPDH